MRIYNIIVFLLFLTYNTILAQPYIGIYGGMNNTNFAGDTPTDARYRSKSGYIFGVNADFKLTDEVLLSFQPGFNKSIVGVFFLDDSTNVYIDSVDININFAVLPVLANIISNNKRWYFSSGLEFGFLISNSASSGLEDVDITDQTNKFNLAVNFGLTYKIPIGNPFLFFSARYSQGLVNISNVPDANSLIPRIKSTGLQLRFGIQVPIKKNEQ